jgi:ornithine carbamoyltransferase
MDGPRSCVFEQAENRLHTQKAVLLVLLNYQFSLCHPKRR